MSSLENLGYAAEPGTGQVSAPLYCVVPPGLGQELTDRLRRHFAASSSVQVLVERRSCDRRSATRRGRRTDVGEERRRIRAQDGRRVTERRAITVAVAAPRLPHLFAPHRERLAFHEHLSPGREHNLDHQTARLVTRFQLGDQSAFCELYSLYFDAVFRYVRVVLTDHHAAEDVTQQTFTNVLRALPLYERRPGTPFRAWLFRIARNEALSYVRKHSRFDIEAPDQLDGRIERDPAPTPLDGLDWLSDNDLMLFVERLPVAQRQVLMLRYMVGLKGSEVAAVLDRTPQAVRKLEHRALRFLQLRLSATRSRGELSLRRSSMLIRVRRAPVLRGRRFALAMTRYPGGGLNRSRW